MAQLACRYLGLTSSRPQHLHDADERSPLLVDGHPIDRQHALAGTAAQTILQEEDPHKRKRKTQIYIFSMLVLFIIAIDFASYLAQAPQIEIYERIICDDYYKHGDLRILHQDHLNWSDSEYDCQINPVRTQLAYISQIQETLRLVPGLVLAIPYGILADRIGRRKVFLWSIIGSILTQAAVNVICWFPWTFPIRTIWISPIFMIIGGGDQVTVAVLFTILADILDEKDRANAFAAVSASVLVSDLAANPIAAFITNRSSPWVPTIISFFLLLLALLQAYIFIPETLPIKVHAADDLNQIGPDGADAIASQSHKQPSMVERAIDLKSRFKSSTRFIFHNRNVVLLLSSFFAMSLSRQSAGFQLQYVHNVFGWSIATASYLISLRGLVTMFLFLVVFPTTAYLLCTRLAVAPRAKDLFLARVSMLIWTLGSLLLAVSASSSTLIAAVVLFATGSGVGVAVRSLITSLVDPTHVATLYTAVALMTGLGGMVAGPVLAWTFSKGLDLGGAWVGLPWFVVAILLALTSVALLAVRLGQGDEERVEEVVGDIATSEAQVLGNGYGGV